MKKTSYLRLCHLSIFILVCFCILITTAYAEDKTVLQKAIKGFMPYANPVVTETKQSGNWVLAFYLTKDDEGKNYKGAAIILKQGAKWKTLDVTGCAPSTDFLRVNKVPKALWVTLLSRETIAKQQTVLDVLNKNNKTSYHPNINVVGEWAMVSWIDTEFDSGGQSLFRKKGTTWKAVTGGGGVMGREHLLKKGVPSAIINQLMGVE